MLAYIAYRLNGYPVREVIVIWANFAGASYAAFANFMYSRNDPILRVKRIHRLIGIYAIFYACAYAVLLFGPWSRLDWSRFISPMSIPVWWVVWTAWARFRRKNREEFRPKTADELAALIAESIEP